VFQERFLAPRSVNFGEHLSWSCSTGNTCQCREIASSIPPLDLPPLFIPGAGAIDLAHVLTPPVRARVTQLDQDSSLMHWYNMVRTYSALDLTNPADKLPALSGICSVYQPLINSPYLAGLWKHDLRRGLMWMLDRYTGKNSDLHISRSVPYRAPTWSWASVDSKHLENESSRKGASIYSYIELFATSAPPDFEILDAYTEVDGFNTFGRVSNGMITLQARYLQPTGIRSYNNRQSVETEPSEYELVFGEEKIWSEYNDVYPEHPYLPQTILKPDLDLEDTVWEASIAASSLYCIWVASSDDHDHEYALVLKKSETLGKYERVGIADFKIQTFYIDITLQRHRDNKMWDSAGIQIFEII
jgi:hypothetical protein